MPADLNRFYLHGGVNTSVEVALSMAEEIVVPESCELFQVAVSMTVGITADTVLTLIINGTATSVTTTLPDTLVDDSGAVLTFSQQQHVFPADRITLRSDGATVNATAAHFQWIMRR